MSPPSSAKSKQPRSEDYNTTDDEAVETPDLPQKKKGRILFLSSSPPPSADAEPFNLKLKLKEVKDSGSFLAQQQAYCKWVDDLEVAKEDPLTSLSDAGLLYLHFRMGAQPSDKFLGQQPDAHEQHLIDDLVYPVTMPGILSCYTRLLQVLVNRL